MPASNLIERVAELIAGGEELVPDALRPELAELQRRLREPVRVAVVGRVSAGKSTMVNALLGQRVAPTIVERVHPPRHLVPLRACPSTSRSSSKPAGRSTPSSPPTARCPNTLDVPARRRPGTALLPGERPPQVDDADRHTRDRLGPSRVQRDDRGAARSEEADSAAAAQRADAVVFLFNQVLMQDELEALQMFRAASGNDPTRSAASAVGVLSKADQLGDGTRDPWNVAIELAGRLRGQVPQRGRHRRPGRRPRRRGVGSRHVDRARRQAAVGACRHGRGRIRQAALVHGPVRLRRRSGALRKSASACSSMLDLYGIQNAVKFLRSGTHGAFALRRELSALSGISEVKRTLATYFSEQDHVLKVRSVARLAEQDDLHSRRGPGSCRTQALQGSGRRAAARSGHAPHRRARGLARVLHRAGPSSPQPSRSTRSRVSSHPGHRGAGSGWTTRTVPRCAKLVRTRWCAGRAYIVTEASLRTRRKVARTVEDVPSSCSGRSSSERSAASTDEHPGTSASTSGPATPSAAVAQDGNVTTVDVEANGRSRLPSSVFLSLDGQILVGTAAQHQAVFAPERYEPTPKRVLGEGELFLGDRLVPVSELAAAVLRSVYTEACRQQGETVPSCCANHPPGRLERRAQVGAQRGGREGRHAHLRAGGGARRRRRAHQPGQRPSRARRIAVYDFGGGTFDAAVLLRTEGRLRDRGAARRTRPARRRGHRRPHRQLPRRGARRRVPRGLAEASRTRPTCPGGTRPRICAKRCNEPRRP